MKETIARFKEAFRHLTLKGVRSMGVVHFHGDTRVHVQVLGRFIAKLRQSDDANALLMMMRSLPQEDFTQRVRSRHRVDVKGATHCWLYDFLITPRTICRMTIKDGLLTVDVIGYGRETTITYLCLGKTST